jgi:hypothetical protein
MFRRNIPKRTCYILLAILLLCCNEIASAVPILQLYIPGSEYNPDTESWLSYNNPFELQVLGASHNGNITEITSLVLDIAVPEDWWNDNASVTVVGPGCDIMIGSNDWDWGMPSGQHPHGIYPTYYYSLPLPVMDIGSGTDTIYNYNPGEDGQDTGVIYSYTISYSAAFGIHMDASGIATKKNGNQASVFSPYSHDADAPIIPEPTTIVLMSFGLFGLLGVVIRQRRKKK